MTPKPELEDPVILRQFFVTAMFIEDDASAGEVAAALGRAPHEVQPMLDAMREAFKESNQDGGIILTPCELILLDMMTRGPEMMRTMNRATLRRVFTAKEVQRIMDTRTRLFHKGLVGPDYRPKEQEK